MFLGWIVSGGAVIMVFLYHCLFWVFGRTKLEWAGKVRDFSADPELSLLSPLTFGWAGVAIFFVVSGFCIHLSFLKNSNWLAFFWRRFFRIYPPYFIAMVGFLGLDLLRGDYKGQEMAQFASHALLVHNFWDDTYFGINPSFWSIAVEAQLYLLYPLLLGALRLYPWKKVLVALLLIESSIKIFESGSLLENGPLAYALSWAIGAYLADEYFRREQIRWPRILKSGWLFLAVLATWLFKPITDLSFLTVALLTASFLAGALNKEQDVGNETREPKGWRAALGFLGAISYSFYLLHQPIISLVNSLLLGIGAISNTSNISHMVILSCVSLCVAVGVSWVFHMLVERPGANFGAKLWNIMRTRSRKEVN